MAYLLEAGVQEYLRALSGHFDRTAHAVPVLRVADRAGGGHLKLANFRLTLVPGPASAALPLAIDLGGLTLAALAARIAAAGYATSALDDRLDGVLAIALAEERGAPFDGVAYLALATNPLWRLFVPVAAVGGEVRAQAAAALGALDLRLAAGIWLDRLADLYGAHRHDDEGDDALRTRLRFHAIGRHTTNVGLAQLIRDVAGVAASVDDGPIDYFRLGQHSARALTRSQANPRRLPPGVVPLVTVTLHETLPADTAPYPIADELGARFWPHCWAKGAATHATRLVTAAAGEGAMRLPIGAAGRARRFADPRLRALRPQRAGRALWHLVDTYKAAGVAQVLRFPRVIALADSAPEQLLLQNGARGQGQNSAPTTGYVRRITLTRYLAAVAATSRVDQAAPTTAAIIGPLRVAAARATGATLRARVARRAPTSLAVSLNHPTATDLEWPREHPVVRSSTWTTTTVLQRAHSREEE